MATLNILEFPDDRLRDTAEPVALFDAALRQLVEEMAQAMYAARGVGLAATQVGILQRVIVLDISPGRNELMTLVNPALTSASGSQEHPNLCKL